MRNSYKTILGKSEGKRPLGRLRHTKETRLEVAQDGVQWQALMNSAMNLRVPQKTVKFLTS